MSETVPEPTEFSLNGEVPEASNPDQNPELPETPAPSDETKVYDVALAPGASVSKLRVRLLDGSRVEIAQKIVSVLEHDLERIKAGARAAGVALRIGHSK